ncbi:uncharacterized protein LOC105698081 [Orussus abietinus]|uniref:uncharacterized protein LOC105698081 n=1 Tax=Orussus abietinus TaxID=222816 RepID=UPI000C715E1B|nr:uncharacterized protein LOC105698081 [Orussus abietinus]
MSNFKSDIKLKKSVSNDAIYSMITEFTKHHNNILRYVEDLQSLFGSILFIEFLSSATLIALVTFQMKMSSADSILSFFTFIFYFSFVLLHMFMYCTFGTMLTNQSHLIVSACWNGSLWDDDLSERCRKSLLTIMIRATKPCYLIGGKCFTAGLEQFTMIIKSAVSYYALINTFLE